MHRTIERILMPETQNLRGDLLLVPAERVGNIQGILRTISESAQKIRETENIVPDDTGYLYEEDMSRSRWEGLGEPRNDAKPRGLDKLDPLIVESVLAIDRIVKHVAGPIHDQLEMFARVRIWDHIQPTGNADPHIDSMEEGINTIRVAAAWPSNTLYLMSKRIQGTKYEDFIEREGENFGGIFEEHTPFIKSSKWIQGDPGDVMMFSGLASVHMEPEVDPNQVLPRTLIDITYRPFDVPQLKGVNVLSNPYNTKS